MKRSVKSYSERLSSCKNKGVCGLPETFDTKRSVIVKVKKLAELIKKSKTIVIITGAGISTAAGIPDFRGPNGVWTQEESNNRKRRYSQLETEHKHDDTRNEFVNAKPTISHQIITEMEKKGLVQFLITQNVDALHLRAGFPAEKLAEVHGNIFLEKCSNLEQCHFSVLRDSDVGGVGCKPTGNKCPKCKGNLVDTVLDWHSPLQEPDAGRAESFCSIADLIICLGSSLRIYPVGEWPLYSTHLAIINLQATPIDAKADILIHAKCDEVMKQLKDYCLQ